jgi:PAS domain S-box-containing protein
VEKVIDYLRKAQGQLRERHEKMRLIQEELRQSCRRYRDLFDAAPVGYVTANLSGRILESNRVAEAMLGHEQVLRGHLFEHFISLDDRPAFATHFRRCRRGLAMRPFEVALRRQSGTTFPAQVRLLRSQAFVEDVDELRIIIVDLTEMKAIQEELEVSKRHLELRVETRTRELTRINDELETEIARRQRLEGELLEISERERRRFGQDLHDETCQALTGHAMELATLSQRLKDTESAPELQRLAVRLNQLVENTRRIAHGLHPVCLSGGLSAALEELATQYSPKIPCDLHIEDLGITLSSEMELSLYRIAQEALTNTVKHAQASRVVVRLHRNGTRIVLSIQDNGVGLPKPMPENPGGMGLDILSYRARSMGAQLTIESLKKGGVRVTCHLPISAIQP